MLVRALVCDHCREPMCSLGTGGFVNTSSGVSGSVGTSRTCGQVSFLEKGPRVEMTGERSDVPITGDYITDQNSMPALLLSLHLPHSHFVCLSVCLSLSLSKINIKKKGGHLGGSVG